MLWSCLSCRYYLNSHSATLKKFISSSVMDELYKEVIQSESRFLFS